MPRNSSVIGQGSRGSRHVGMLSAFPPDRHGVAGFASALAAALARVGEQVLTVAVDRGNGSVPSGSHHLRNGDRASVVETAATLSQGDVAIVHHDDGLYGGTDGEELLELLALVEAPTIVVLHRVPIDPTAHQRQVLEAMAGHASALVVMTHAALDRLLTTTGIDAAQITVIPRGAWAPTGWVDPQWGPGVDRPQLLTWGLLRPGKGIEHMIEAMQLLGVSHPGTRYTVAGVTHPDVVRREGERYRQSLVRLADELGVSHAIRFDDAYRSIPALQRFVQSAAVVVLPYDSRDEVTSCVLVDAVAAGRPVIATAFPHAVELLTGGAGIVVPHGDAGALAEAVRTTLTDRAAVAAMATKARALAASFSWSAVAEQYRTLCDDVVAGHVHRSTEGPRSQPDAPIRV